MVLNWTPEIIVDFITAIILLTTSLLTYFEPKTKKLKAIFLIRLAIFFMAVFYFLDGLGILFLSLIISRISTFFLVAVVIFLLMGINYITRESINSIYLVLLSCIGTLTIYLAFQPGLMQIETQFGYLKVSWIGVLALIDSVLSIFTVVFLMSWGIRTWLNTPLLIKQDAMLFLLGFIIVGPIYASFYVFSILGIIYVAFADILFSIGVLIFNIAIIKEPKLLYIFPFTVHRIAVKDRNGHPLFDHDWSESFVDENIFTGFLNAVQLMSEEVMDIGGILDINLEQGILILKESERITVGLVTTKSSRLLRDSVVNFTTDFEEKFDRELKSSIGDMSSYDSAYELIEKHFSNFPQKIIKSKKQPLLLAGKYAKIPLELENKLRKIFPDEEEYETIKTELIKSPLSFSSEFSTLYEELKDEIEKISDEEMKYFDENSERKKE